MGFVLCSFCASKESVQILTDLSYHGSYHLVEYLTSMLVNWFPNFWLLAFPLAVLGITLCGTDLNILFYLILHSLHSNLAVDFNLHTWNFMFFSFSDFSWSFPRILLDFSQSPAAKLHKSAVSKVSLIQHYKFRTRETGLRALYWKIYRFPDVHLVERQVGRVG